MNVNIQLRFGWMLGFRAAQYNITLSDSKGMGAVSEAPCYINSAIMAEKRQHVASISAVC